MSADPLKEKRESRAMCAHLSVKYAPVDHGNGTASDRWTCVLCGHDFWPKQWLFPAPWQRAVAREAHAPNLPFSESPNMNLSEVQTFQKLSVWLRENALPPYKQILSALATKIEELERVERVRPDDVDEALIWIIGERHHQRVREEMAAYLNDKMAMRALAAHSAAPREREPIYECASCHHEFEIVRHRVKEVPCPNCGKSVVLAALSQDKPALRYVWHGTNDSREGSTGRVYTDPLMQKAYDEGFEHGQDKPTRAGEPK